VKFTIPEPEPPQPYCPFAVNLRAGIQLDPSCGLLCGDVGDTETPLHPGALEYQAMRAWGRWDNGNQPYRQALWPPIALGSRYQGQVVLSRWFI
jgi:hypothetical protein